jgi:[histone H3]-trimethyl-L-lysine4 demethylase
MLLCDGCDGGMYKQSHRFVRYSPIPGYHIYCLDPALPGVPKGQWFCHSCLDGSNNDFGFEEGEEHSLTTFQARDMAFRKLWFESHPPSATDEDVHMAFDGEHPGPDTVTQIGSVSVSEYDVEREFWRLVQSAEDTVEVEYGADVHSTTHGRYASGCSR